MIAAHDVIGNLGQTRSGWPEGQQSGMGLHAQRLEQLAGFIQSHNRHISGLVSRRILAGRLAQSGRVGCESKISSAT